MMKKGETKRKRIIIYYTLAIVLPCLILGLLAFRGIKNDQALVEREQRGILLETGRRIIMETDTCLTLIENGMATIAGSVAVPDQTVFTDSLLSRFILQQKAVKGIFFIRASGEIYMLNNGLLYLPDRSSADPSLPLPPYVQEIFDKGWEYEFREKNYAKALKHYQGLFPLVTGEQSTGEMLNAIARLQKKLNQGDEAMKTYDRILKDFPQIFLRNEFPLGAAALLEKSLLCLAGKDTVSALQNVHLLLSLMKKSFWAMEYPAYNSFRSKTEEIVSLCRNSRSALTNNVLKGINMLTDSLSASERHTEYLLAYLKLNLPLSAGWLPDPTNYNHRYKSQVDGISCYFSVVLSPNGLWGMIPDREYLLHTVVCHSLIRNSDPVDFSWEVTDADGGLLSKSEQPPGNMAPVYVAFPPHLPSWTLKLHPSEPGLFALLFRPRQSIFLYIFIVIVIILACGLFFTLQTVNNELNLSRMKSYFMSAVSHEFKSPLTSIRQMAEMLVRDRVPAQERKVKYYTTILQQSERLSHLIDNILDFTRMEEGHKVFRFEKSDIGPVVRDIVELFQELNANSGFQINLQVPEALPDIVFDRQALEQVVYNLMDNAIKYSGNSRVIDVQLYTESDKMVIRVRDYGVGIRKEDQDKIFSRFYRAGEELTQNVKGSGIGLAIVKQIVDAHHGEIRVESEMGKGSTFTVRLPVGKDSSNR